MPKQKIKGGKQMKTKVVGRLITIILLLILILGGVFAYLYFGTDLLKSNGQLFLRKNIMENMRIVEHFQQKLI